jgi:hypothetical protein
MNTKNLSSILNILTYVPIPAKTKRRIAGVGLFATFAACSACFPPMVGDGEGDSTGSETGDPGDGDGDPAGCPVGLEGCPCSDADSCLPGLQCVDALCGPATPCPIGEAGCACTNGGTCDDGSVCEEGICQCTPGELGCACDNGVCGTALNCADGVCAIPELVSEAANGWGEVYCVGDNDVRGSNDCFAARGDVYFPVISACEVAEKLLAQTWMPNDGMWIGGTYKECSEGLPIPPAQGVWDDAVCFLTEQIGGGHCLGRIGHLWTTIDPECIGPVSDDFDPWGVGAIDMYGCDVDQPPPPTAQDVDEWRCGPLPPPYTQDLCTARIDTQWTWSPKPACVVSALEADGLTNVGWSPFACLSAMD